MAAIWDTTKTLLKSRPLYKFIGRDVLTLWYEKTRAHKKITYSEYCNLLGGHEHVSEGIGLGSNDSLCKQVLWTERVNELYIKN